MYYLKFILPGINCAEPPASRRPDAYELVFPRESGSGIEFPERSLERHKLTVFIYDRLKARKPFFQLFIFEKYQIAAHFSSQRRTYPECTTHTVDCVALSGLRTIRGANPNMRSFVIREVVIPAMDDLKIPIFVPDVTEKQDRDFWDVHGFKPYSMYGAEKTSMYRWPHSS